MSRIRGPHHVDRDIPEFLQELRVAQTGGQIFFAFLFSIAFTPAFAELTEGQRMLYAWNLLVVVLSGAVLVAPVAVHQWNFGRGLRPQWLVMTHVLALVGLVLLGAGITMGMALVASVIGVGAEVWLPVAAAAALTFCWLLLPLVVRISGDAWPVSEATEAGANDEQTVEELRHRAKDLGLRANSRQRKAELVDAIRRH